MEDIQKLKIQRLNFKTFLNPNGLSVKRGNCCLAKRLRDRVTRIMDKDGVQRRWGTNIWRWCFPCHAGGHGQIAICVGRKTLNKRRLIERISCACGSEEWEWKGIIIITINSRREHTASVVVLPESPMPPPIPSGNSREFRRTSKRKR